MNMMKFKDFIDIDERIDFGEKIENLMEQNMIPISPKMMYNLGYSDDENIIAYHMTNAQDLKSLMTMGKKAQISCFTKPSLQLSNLPSNPNVVVKIQGRMLIESSSDLFTYLDYDGRRWIKLDAKAELRTGPGQKLKFLFKGVMTKLNNKYKEYSVLKYRDYLREINKILDNGGYKLLNEHLKIITFEYNEVILDKVKILGAWDFNNNKKDDILKNKIKYLGYMSASDLLKL